MAEFRLRGGVNMAKFGIGPKQGLPGYGLPEIQECECLFHLGLLGKPVSPIKFPAAA